MHLQFYAFVGRSAIIRLQEVKFGGNMSFLRDKGAFGDKKHGSPSNRKDKMHLE